MKQTAQTPHFKTAARIPESSLNTGLSVPTTTEPSPLPVSPDTQETPDMVEHDGKDVYAAQSAINNLSKNRETTSPSPLAIAHQPSQRPTTRVDRITQPQHTAKPPMATQMLANARLPLSKA